MKAVFTGPERELQADLLQIWTRLLETTDLCIDDDFFDKGGDSLLATDLMLELERLIGKPIPQTLLFEASTIRTLSDRLIQAQELQLKPAVKIGTVSNGETPLLFFHGDWTAGGFYVKNMARKLGPELPIIAIAPHGMRGQPMPQSIEDMAADRLPAIMEAQPRGPYRLGGHCVGAAVAFETARLLVASGHEVELIAMVDPLWVVDGEILKTSRELATQGESTEGFEIEAKPDDAPLLPDLTGNPTESSSAPNGWDLIEGLNVEEVQGSGVVSGQHILRLVAVGADRRHALGVRFDDLAPSGIYRAIAWVKANSGVRVMIEARDSFDPQTEKPSNYGVAQLDLAARSVVSSTGDIIASGVEAAADDWVKVWIDLRSTDGQIFALIGLLEGRNNRHIFTATDQSVIFGGFEISYPRVVRPVSQFGSPLPRTEMVTKVTTISELPRLPDSFSAPNKWDLIEGLNATVLQGSAVVSGQHILRLVAVGADCRHALGVRFDDLAPGGIYRAIAWVKADPGVRVMIEARDSLEPNTEKPSNYGVAQFDLAARSVVNSTGDIIASGAEAAADDWVKVWFDLRSRDGQIFALIGLLEGSNDRHVFTPADQSVIFGGFEICFPPILEQYRDLLMRYSPAPLSVPLIIFTSEFDGRPWCRLGRDYEFFRIVGGHYDWLTLRAGAFADRLKARLGRIPATAEGTN
jgi:acyl carrier protein